MATPTRKKPKINLGTAEQADGALAAPVSAYELVGIRDIRYREQSYSAYEARLRSTHLSDLQDECYRIGVVASSNKEVTIQRMLERYLKENPREREGLAAARAKAQRGASKETPEQQAMRILAAAR